MSVPFLGVSCSFWFLEEYCDHLLPGNGCYCDPARCGLLGSQVELVSWYWKMIFRHGDGLEVGAESPQDGGNQHVSAESS